MASSASEIGNRNRQRVLGALLRQPGLSRTDISNALNLNIASVSRITRDLIKAGLVEETTRFGPTDRPGRRFVGLAPRGDGGYVVGIGLNAFRQSVTLADLRNNKLDEWISTTSPGEDGEDFLRQCVTQAAALIKRHGVAKPRLFGVGIAVAAELDKSSGVVLQSPTFNWTKPVNVRQMVSAMLDAPLALDTPAAAINQSEATFGLGRDARNVATLHCSLGFGLGVQLHSDESDRAHSFGRVLTQTSAPDGSGRKLDEVCGGVGVLLQVYGPDRIASLSDSERATLLVDVIARANTEPELEAVLADMGRRTAESLGLVIEIARPTLLILAGPLPTSRAYVDEFKRALERLLAGSAPVPDVVVSAMTPAGASRLLSLQGNVAMRDLDLNALQTGVAA